MGATKIAWTETTVNPFPGCRKVSPGCQNCYAERMAKRLKAMGKAKYQRVIGPDGKWSGKIGRDPGAMSVGGSGKMIFVNSMGDLGYEGIEQHEFDRAAEWMRLQWQHCFQVLTKRPEELARKLATYKSKYPEEKVNRELTNVWLGVTCENQEWADKRIPVLLQIPAAVRFVSLEPLLGPIDVEEYLACGSREPCSLDQDCGPQCPQYVGLDWVIVGCESGPKRRPCDNQWVTDIVDQCHAAGVPVFVKQLEIKGKVVHDAEQIAGRIGCRVEDIRQWPKCEGDRP